MLFTLGFGLSMLEQIEWFAGEMDFFTRYPLLPASRSKLRDKKLLENKEEINAIIYFLFT